MKLGRSAPTSPQPGRRTYAVSNPFRGQLTVMGYADFEPRTVDEPARWVSWCRVCTGTTAIADRRRDVLEPLEQHYLIEHYR